MTRPITTAPADTARAMHDSEMRGSDMVEKQRCKCVYENASNTVAVRKGYILGGVLKKMCDKCLMEKEKEDQVKIRGQDMQDAPERIWATEDKENLGEDRFHATRPMKGLTEYTRTDLCITEAECQRWIDAAVQAERDACADVAVNRHWHWGKLGAACLVDDDASACADIAAAIRALIAQATP